MHWGFYSKKLAPIISINSQDYVTMETITHHAGDDYDRMIAGDPAIEAIYNWTAEGKTVSDRGPGVHILTGPVYVCGAEPGDLLEVKIVDLKLRPSGSDPTKTLLKDSSAKLRDFLMNGMNLTEDEAFSLITVGDNFAITQVVDGNWGVHGIIPKGILTRQM